MSMRAPLKTLIDQREPLLLDGAMGTELYNRGVFINRCFEDANLSSPELVNAIHRDYRQAGAKILTSNTWGANSFKLAKHNLQDRVEEINRRGVEIARLVAREDLYVAGSIGPLGIRLEPWGPTSREEARAAFATQIRAQVEAGVNALLFETFADISELQQAILAAREVAPEIPVVACLVIDQEGLTTMGTPVEWAIRHLDEWNVDALGLNCSVGPQPMAAVLPKIKAVTQRPLIIQPNAGLPRQVEGRSIYMCSPEYMAEFAKIFLREGVTLVGGCCGTTPDHTRAMASAIRHRRSMIKTSVALTEPAKSDSEQPVEIPPVPIDQRSKLAYKLAHNQPVRLVELMPPVGVQSSKIIASSRLLREAGVDAINIPDGPRASARMSASMTSLQIQQQADIESVLHFTCRDRNLLGMQSSLLGLHAVGIRNLLLVTGDPPKLGTYPNATGVFDIDAIGLTNMVRRLNAGLDLGGRSIGGQTAFSIGVGVNPVAMDFEYEMKRFYFKVDAGAEWAITQPVFDAANLFRFLDYADAHHLRIPVIAGIWPLTSHQNALFLAHEVPGVVIPPAIIDRMARAKTPDDARKVGIDIACELIQTVRSRIQGLAVSAPMGRVEPALEVIKAFDQAV